MPIRPAANFDIGLSGPEGRVNTTCGNSGRHVSPQRGNTTRMRIEMKNIRVTAFIIFLPAFVRFQLLAGPKSVDGTRRLDERLQCQATVRRWKPRCSGCREARGWDTSNRVAAG